MRRTKLGDLNILTLLLVALKLFGVISISWWIVVAPTLAWLTIVALVVLLVIAIVITGVARGENIIDKMDEFNKRQMGNKRVNK